jgi:hypothetical protein
MELSYMPSRKDRNWLLRTWYGFSDKLVEKYLPGTSRQTTKAKSTSRKVMGNRWTKDKIDKAKINGFEGHYDRFEKNAEYRATMVSQGVGRILVFVNTDGSFDRFADGDFFKKIHIDVTTLYEVEKRMVDLGEYLEGYGEDVYEHKDALDDPGAEINPPSPSEIFYNPKHQ